MANGNMWDNSQTILSDQSGQNYARAIRDFGSGVKEYFDRKDQQEKEDATVDWLDQNQEAVHQLFPQLANVKDPAERKKVIKAGIKGAGLENLVQVRGFLENQRRAQAQEGPIKEMQAAQLEHLNVLNQQGTAMMADRASEGRAIAAAGSQNAGIADQIQGGAKFGQLDPNMQPDRAGIYMREGGRNPAMMQAMMKERPFVPSAVELPGGGRMLMTSRSSAVPDPAMRNQPKNEGLKSYNIGGREIYVGPGNKYFDKKGAPISFKTSAGELDPVQKAEFKSLPGEIADIETKISEAAGETRKGNKKPGPDWLPGLGTYDDRIKKLQGDLTLKKRRLAELQQLSGAADGEIADDGSAPAGRQVVNDPFSYVLGR